MHHPIYQRDPTYVAQLAATLDELSNGRAEVVFGSGKHRDARAIRRRVARDAAYRAPAGAHHVMRTFLDEGSIDFAGDLYSCSGVTTAAWPV